MDDFIGIAATTVVWGISICVIGAVLVLVLRAFS